MSFNYTFNFEWNENVLPYISLVLSQQKISSEKLKKKENELKRCIYEFENRFWIKYLFCVFCFVLFLER